MVDAAIFMLGWFSILIFSGFCFRLAGLQIFEFTVPSVFYIFYISFNYLGIPLLYFHLIPHLYNYGIQNRGEIQFLWMMSASCLILLIFGYISVNEVYKRYNKQTPICGHQYFHNPSLKRISIVLALGIFIFLYYLKVADKIPIFELIRKNSLELNKLRSDVQLFQGRRYIYQIYFRDILPFLSFYLLALIMKKNSKKIILLFLIAFFFTCLTNIMNFQKAPIGFYFLGLFMVYFIFKNKKVSSKNLVVLSMMIFPLFMVLYVTFMGKQLDASLVLAPFRRILAGQNASAFFHLKMFPEHERYLYGRSFPNPKGILPFENYKLSKNVQDFMKPGLREKGIHGSAPAAYWAGIYANFGVIGALLSSFIIGAIIFTIHLALSKKPITPLKAALITWMALHLASLTITSINRVLIDPNLIGVLACYFLLKYNFKLFRNKQFVYKRS